MGEFKGTKCDWEYAFNELFPNWDEKDVLEIAEQKEIDAFIKGYNKATKDSKAPEMLEMLIYLNRRGGLGIETHEKLDNLIKQATEL